MTVVLISGVLTFVVGLLVFRPFSVTTRQNLRSGPPADDRHLELLRQLRDLDDDFTAGKLTQQDHVRLRDPLEREVAVALRRKTRGPVGGSGVVTSDGAAGSITSRPSRTGDASRPPRRSGHRAVALLALGGAAASIATLLVGAASARHPGQTITGNTLAGATSLEGGQGSTTASHSGANSPTPQQLAAVAVAEAQVQEHPKDLSAHLTLAEAYASAGASQLAAVEYLAVTRMDPSNAEADTYLALLAFEVGRATLGESMVDRVLAADPNYPEALYVQGLIQLIALRRPKDAERDFTAYLALAPFGSHRAEVATLLVLAQSRDHR